jgi:hypothetical protein
MAALRSVAPAAAEIREYDPEISDIADYVHNKPVNSDLAVSFPSTLTAWCGGPASPRAVPRIAD